MLTTRTETRGEAQVKITEIRCDACNMVRIHSEEIAGRRRILRARPMSRVASRWREVDFSIPMSGGRTAKPHEFPSVCSEDPECWDAIEKSPAWQVVERDVSNDNPEDDHV